MTLHLVHADAVEATPWRNGGGVTRELLAWPHGADWRVRISVAEIDADEDGARRSGGSRGGGGRTQACSGDSLAWKFTARPGTTVEIACL